MDAVSSAGFVTSATCPAEIAPFPVFVSAARVRVGAAAAIRSASVTSTRSVPGTWLDRLHEELVAGRGRAADDHRKAVRAERIRDGAGARHRHDGAGVDAQQRSTFRRANVRR